MMKKTLVIVTSAVILLFNLISSLPVSAYSPVSSLYSSYFVRGSSQSFSFTDDGVLLIHSFFKTSVDVDSLSPSDRNLDLSYFTGGTWQGNPISELTSNKICDQSDTVGFSQTVSVTTDSNWFIYSVVICLPCVAGDSFTIKSVSSKYAYETACYANYSILYGVSSVKKVYQNLSSLHSGDSISYTTKSDNQYLICVYSADKFTPAQVTSFHNYIRPNFNDDLCSNYSNITRVGSNSFASIYSSTFGLSSGSDLSLQILDNVNIARFTVYEIYTDGTFHPGYDDGSSSGDSGSAGTGDITVNVDMTETNSKLDSLIAAVKALPAEIWDCFKIGIGASDSDTGSGDSSSGDSSGGSSGGSSSLLPPSDGDLNVDLDPEEVGSTLDSISDDFSSSGSLYLRLRGSFHFFWKFTDNFFLATDLYGLVGVSLILALVIWLLNR